MILLGLLFFIFSPGVFYTIPPWYCNGDQNTSLVAAAVHAILFGIVYYCIFKGLSWPKPVREGFQEKKPVAILQDKDDIKDCKTSDDCKPNIILKNCRGGRCRY